MGPPSDFENETDELLVNRAHRGDEAAFAELLRRHEGRVLRVLRLLGVRSQDREDVAQEVFVRAFRHLGGYRPGRSFAAWLYRITVNASHDYRARQARQSQEDPWQDGGLGDAPDEGAGPLEALERAEGRRRLEGALLVLSERERAVFVLCELEGLDTAHVARTLGITRITVRRHLSRAREHLRRVLAGGPDAGSSDRR